MEAIVDVRGRLYCVGQKVAKGVSLNKGGSTAVVICEVTRLENGRIYLDNSKQPIKFPERLAILG